MNKALVAVVGPSGSGKSSSLRNLDPKKTIILDGERKGFPFRNTHEFRILPFDSPGKFDQQFKVAIDTEGIELIVVESFTKYAEMVKTFCQNTYKGFDIWSNYAKIIRGTLNKVKNEKAVIVFTAIDENIKDSDNITGRIISVDGRELQGKIDPEFLIIFYTKVIKDPKEGKMIYNFMTNSDGTTTAKSPMGMFDGPLVANDLNWCLEQARAYFKNGE